VHEDAAQNARALPCRSSIELLKLVGAEAAGLDEEEWGLWLRLKEWSE
jgi:hypothetical protein